MSFEEFNVGVGVVDIGLVDLFVTAVVEVFVDALTVVVDNVTENKN